MSTSIFLWAGKQHRSVCPFSDQAWSLPPPVCNHLHMMANQLPCSEITVWREATLWYTQPLTAGRVQLGQSHGNATVDGDVSSNESVNNLINSGWNKNNRLQNKIIIKVWNSEEPVTIIFHHLTEQLQHYFSSLDVKQFQYNFHHLIVAQIPHNISSPHCETAPT